MLESRGLPTDVSTAALIDADGRSYTHSTSVLRLFRFMGFPYTLLGALLLLIPACLRDVGYKLFAMHRGTIWKRVKYAFGMGDIHLSEHRDKMIGLVEPLDPAWGFSGTAGELLPESDIENDGPGGDDDNNSCNGQNDNDDAEEEVKPLVESVHV
jgi:hypothetical protein